MPVQFPTGRRAYSCTSYLFSALRLRTDTDEGAGTWGKGAAAQDTAGTTVVNPPVGRKTVAPVVSAAATKGRGAAEGEAEGGAEGGWEGTARAEREGKDRVGTPVSLGCWEDAVGSSRPAIVPLESEVEQEMSTTTTDAREPPPPTKLARTSHRWLLNLPTKNLAFLLGYMEGWDGRSRPTKSLVQRKSRAEGVRVACTTPSSVTTRIGWASIAPSKGCEAEAHVQGIVGQALPLPFTYAVPLPETPVFARR